MSKIRSISVRDRTTHGPTEAAKMQTEQQKNPRPEKAQQETVEERLSAQLYTLETGPWLYLHYFRESPRVLDSVGSEGYQVLLVCRTIVLELR